MGLRRSAGDVQTGRDWRAFLDRHAVVVSVSGLPACVTETRDRWDDFLMHGYLDHHDDPSGFTVDALSASQLAALRVLANDYFSATEADYTPMALLGRERDRAP